MAKKKDRYLLIDRLEQRSALNGGIMWRLRFYRLDDGTLWEMTVDAAYNNFKRCGWSTLVQETNPFGAYQNIHRTDRVTADGLGVVSADHRAELVVRVEDQAEAVALAELDQQERQRRNKYGELFE